MGTEWLAGLACDFKDFLEGQKFVDVEFQCIDGSVLCHRIVVGMISNFMNSILATADMSDSSKIVILLPDFSAFDISDFIMALYGCDLPPDLTTMEQLSDMFKVPKKKTVRKASDISQEFGQLCSEIEREFDFGEIFGDIQTPPSVAEHTTKIVTERIPPNAQLIQMAGNTAASTNNTSTYERHVINSSTETLQPGRRQQQQEQFYFFGGVPFVGEKPMAQGNGFVTQKPDVKGDNQKPAESKDSNFFWTCHLCGQRVPTQASLRDHMTEVHDPAKKLIKRRHEEQPKPANATFTCSKCGQRFGSREKLEGHFRITHTRPLAECKQCKKIFKTGTLLEAHIHKFHKSVAVVMPTQSNVMPAEIRSSQIQPSQSDYPMMPVVDEITPMYAGMDLTLPEEEEEVYEMFDDDGSEIVQVSSGDTDYVTHGYICSECGKQFDSVAKLNYHSKLTHRGEKPNNDCPKCPGKFFQVKNLKQHLQMKHPDFIGTIPIKGFYGNPF